MGVVRVMSHDMVEVHKAMCSGQIRVPGVEPVLREANEVGGRIELSLWPLGFKDARGNHMWIEGSMLHAWGSTDPRVILASFKAYVGCTVDDTF